MTNTEKYYRERIIELLFPLIFELLDCPEEITIKITDPVYWPGEEEKPLIGTAIYPTDNSYHILLSTGKKGDADWRNDKTGGRNVPIPWQPGVEPYKHFIISKPFKERVLRDKCLGLNSEGRLSDEHEFIHTVDEYGRQWKILNNYKLA